MSSPRARQTLAGLGCHPGTCWFLRDVKNCPHPFPGHCERAGLRGMRAGELTPPLPPCSTRKSKPCTLLTVTGEQAPRMRTWNVWLHHLLERAGELSLSLNSCSIQESGSCSSLGSTVEMTLVAWPWEAPESWPQSEGAGHICQAELVLRSSELDN